MDELSAFGLFAVMAMLVCYALEDRSHWFILAFARSCALGSLYAVAADQQSIACTLTAGDLHDRLAWIATLNRDALRGYVRADLTKVIRAGLWSQAQGGWDRRMAMRAALIQGRRDRIAVKRCKASRPDQDV